MHHDIVLADEALEDLRRLTAAQRAAIKEALERYLRHAPASASKSRIKRLRGMSRPQYRLRVGDMRVFHDVTADTVEILAILPKSEATSWLDQVGDSVK